MPRVSVIIPSYNHEKYVTEAIQSVLDQTYQDFEIIITDDGSKDRTVEIIKQFTDPRIKLFCFSQNQGAVVAANHCIRNAQGEFIALLNSDDAFELQKLEKQVYFLDTHPKIGAVFSQVQFIGEDSQPLNQVNNYQDFKQENRTRFEWLNYFFYHGNCLCHPSILICKECYDTIGLYDPRLAQLPDFEFWIRLCQQYEIFIIPEKLIRFRIRDNEANASGNTFQKNSRLFFEFSQVFHHFLKPEILDNISKIFPNLINPKKEHLIEREIAKFKIAREASNSKIPSIKYFGLETLYQFLETEEKIDLLKSNYDFSFIDFIEITGENEIFITPEILSTVELIRSSKLGKLWKLWNQIKQSLFFKKS